LLSWPGFAQETYTISGRVLDAQTGEPLYFVNVFLAYTNIGTTTNADGYFEIKFKNVSASVFTLVVHHIGYQYENIEIDLAQAATQEYTIRLTPIILPGEEVEVVAPAPRQWKKDLKRFIKEFIGTTANAKKCRITNPEVLDFPRDKKGLFVAKTNDLLLVQNHALGYRLKIVLDSFQIDHGWVTYKIFPLFEELEPVHEGDKERWEENRRQTFEGSRKHFLACVYDENFPNRKKFKLYRAYRNSKKIITNRWRDYPIDFSSLAVQSDTSMPGIKQLRLDYALVVIYEKTAVQSIISIMELEKPYLLLDAYGNVLNPPAISVSDNWARQRIADTLPWRYFP